MISALRIADKLLGFFGTGKTLGAGTGFRAVPVVGGGDKPGGDWIANAA
jgi:hypothetical protein